MSVAEAAHRPAKSGRTVKLWLGFLALIAFGVGLAWMGAGAMRPELSDSGLQFRVVKEGTGEPISTADAALLDYVGTLDNGTVFDSSESHGGPQPFTASQVFPGFAEAMARMREGGEYRFTMPPNLAWGEGPAPPGFPADGNLTFDVRVQKVVRGGAALMQQQQQGAVPGQ
ncbi:MAG TPA: FKBP-type peptidyl-prolyl cis-trans isomerase [Sphingomicrobium sp.]|nr:FKBP-type peptidyl-prolyl cis-trans isomerase [Sphingomicrobium sp.]